MSRTCRGAMYEIEIEKPVRVCKGEMRVSLDGEETDGNVARPQEDGAMHRV